MKSEIIAAGLVAGNYGGIFGKAESLLGQLELVHQTQERARRNRSDSRLLFRANREG
jgi:hypothetical protein